MKSVIVESQKTRVKPDGSGRSFLMLSNGYNINHYFSGGQSEYEIWCGRDIPFHKPRKYQSLDKLFKSFPTLNTVEIAIALKDTKEKMYVV